MGPRELPLKITQSEDGTPSVILGEVELANMLSVEGVHIEYVSLWGDHATVGGGHGPSVPQVTLTFGPGALALDFEVDLLRALLADAEAKDA